MYIEELYEDEKISSWLGVSRLSLLFEKCLLTDHCAWDPEALQFLEVVCAGLGAVVGNEDHLFAWAGEG